MHEEHIITRLRDIRRTNAGGPLINKMIENLEIEIAGTNEEDFSCPVEGFDTILSYLSRTNPEAFELIENPVHDTIVDGILASSIATGRGVPIIRVQTPPHMQRRWPKATKLNAYPTAFLDMIFT